MHLKQDTWKYFYRQTTWELVVSVPMFRCFPELHADGCEGGKAANERKDEVAEGEICNQEKSWTLGFTFKMNDDTENQDD